MQKNNKIPNQNNLDNKSLNFSKDDSSNGTNGTNEIKKILKTGKPKKYRY